VLYFIDRYLTFSITNGLNDPRRMEKYLLQTLKTDLKNYITQCLDAIRWNCYWLAHIF